MPKMSAKSSGGSTTSLDGLTDEIRAHIKQRTFVGIDFGTSTTVVSVATIEEGDVVPFAEPLPVAQFDAAGRRIEHHLVPSCLAWNNGKLLVGQGVTPRLRAQLKEGVDLWSSFKMRLGVDLGPEYPYTALPRGGDNSLTIERPYDAARTFFEYLSGAVNEYTTTNGLPRPSYAVSVPASFEANQRRDLRRALADAKIPVEDAALIDEPNAAFLSYVFEMQRRTTGSSILDALAAKARNVLIFDFGAGTCDISILECQIKNSALASRNLAISRFLALGGDDIDRQIVHDVLLPQLCDGKDPSDMFSTAELDKRIVPRLKPVAEELKIVCSKYARKFQGNLDKLAGDTTTFQTDSVAPIQLSSGTVSLFKPQMSVAQFAEVMKPFLEHPSEKGRDTDRSVISQVANALQKARLNREDVGMVLFIGGSSANPTVARAIQEYMGRFVDCVTPQDLRSHVSQGAAMHSLFFGGMGHDIIQPIVSEDVILLTRDDTQVTVVEAGAPVPSPSQRVTVTVVGDRQSHVELPFCVGGRSQVITVLKIAPPNGADRFDVGATLDVAVSVSREKLLQVAVTSAGEKVKHFVENPLANTAVLPQQLSLLTARQELNESLLAGAGRPESSVLLKVAKAAAAAGLYREAAELYEALERLEPMANYANEIDVNYWRAGDKVRSNVWAEKAHARRPTAVTAYNLALNRGDVGDRDAEAKLLQEALKLDANYVPALEAYGRHLARHRTGDGKPFLRRAIATLTSRLNLKTLSPTESELLSRLANEMNDPQLSRRARAYGRKANAPDNKPLVRNEFLAASESWAATAAGKQDVLKEGSRE